MKTITLIATFIFYSTVVNAQVSQVKEEVENAYEYYEDAYNRIQNTKSYISNAFNASSISEVQYEAGNAESSLSSAKMYVGYAEDDANDAKNEASSLNCSDAQYRAGEAKNYFYTAKNKLSYAISELSSASYESDADNLSTYLNNANDYIAQALTQLSNAVDELNNTLSFINNCGVPAETSYYTSSSDTPSCDSLLEYITSNGYSKGTLINYTLDSEWLKEVKAYSYDYKIYVVAKIKRNEYNYQANTYIFCGISSTNWSNFKNGGYGDSDSYGERFHKYIFDFKCDCN
jgi:hypothetical protein